jgi:hypothetical protein
MHDHDHPSTWHLGDEAIYDYMERSLGGQARIEAERHVQSCPECARRLLEAQALFAQIASVTAPRLATDLAPGVVASLRTARKTSVRWRWVLAGQAAAATAALAALGVNLHRWLDQALRDPAFLAVRQAGAQLLADVSGWLAPFLDLVPSSPMRMAPLRLSLPHLQGPVSAWAALAGTALLLGLLGNALLLRSPGGVVPTMADRGNGAPAPGR